MKKTRGFEKVKGFEKEEINLPSRKTKYSAAYDIEALEDCIIPAFTFGQKPTLIKTGIKAYMQSDELLMLIPRSSAPKKKGIIFPHSIGIIDKDYYGNPNNDGHIFIQCINIKNEDVEIKKGEAIAQGIFQKYLITDDDKAEGERVGGFGSTNK